MLKNTFKLSLASIMAFSLSSVFADEIQDEINRLKKENELLELKQQNEALKNNKQSKAPKAKNQVDKSGAFGFCKGQNEHTGCFIGLETGWQNGWYNFYQGPLVKTNGVPINLQLGWQWYYTLNQGLKIQANIGYAYNIIDAKQGTSSKFNANTIRYGIELQWLYDFIASEKHTLGVDLGFGIEAGTTFTDFSNSDKEIRAKHIYPNTKFGTTYRIGLHYYLKEHHQFFLNYKYSFYNIETQKSFTSPDGSTTMNTALAPRNSVNIAYQYKF